MSPARGRDRQRAGRALAAVLITLLITLLMAASACSGDRAPPDEEIAAEDLGLGPPPTSTPDAPTSTPPPTDTPMPTETPRPTSTPSALDREVLALKREIEARDTHENRNRLADLYAEIGMCPEALTEAARGLAMEPDRPGTAARILEMCPPAPPPPEGRTALETGIAHFQAGEFQEALQQFRAASQQRQGAPGETLQWLARTHHALQQYRAAGRHWSLALEEQPGGTNLVGRAHSAHQQGDCEQAYSDAAGALELPEDRAPGYSSWTEALYVGARCALARGDAETAGQMAIAGAHSAREAGYEDPGQQRFLAVMEAARQAPKTETPETGTPEAGAPETGTPETGTPETGTPDPVEPTPGPTATPEPGRRTR